jgi:hypothetical protein
MIMLLYEYYFIVSPKKMITRSNRATWGRRKKEITSTHTDTIVKQRRPWSRLEQERWTNTALNDFRFTN